MISERPESASLLAGTAFRDHAGDLQRFLVRRVGHAQDADDLAQEVFARLLRVRDADLVRNPLSYLLGIATHVVREFRQRKQHERVLYDSDLAEDLCDHSDEAAAQGIARTFQNVALFKGMTTLDNIMTGRNLRMKRNLFWQALRRGPALDEEIANRRVCEEIIDFLEIEHIRKTPVGALPYGLQKRVELGRALAMEPELLLLDEPMAGMNREEKEDMSRFIVEANRYRGATIALIEHDIGVVMDLSDRVVVLDYGRKIADDVPDKVKSDGKVIGAYLGVSH